MELLTAITCADGAPPGECHLAQAAVRRAADVGHGGGEGARQAARAHPAGRRLHGAQRVSAGPPSFDLFDLV
eukprot:1193937-Prorocentrum_minimum.AAC.1